MARSIHRSAVNGRIVPARAVRLNPRETVTQRVGSLGSKPSGGSCRSAITGCYVTEATARRHPNTTIHEGA